MFGAPSVSERIKEIEYSRGVLSRKLSSELGELDRHDLQLLVREGIRARAQKEHRQFFEKEKRDLASLPAWRMGLAKLWNVVTFWKAFVYDDIYQKHARELDHRLPSLAYPQPKPRHLQELVGSYTTETLRILEELENRS